MRHALAAVFLALSLSAPDATENPSAYLQLSAELDLAAISDIELAANEGLIPGAKIAAAFFAVMDAREICAERRISDALARYDTILSD